MHFEPSNKIFYSMNKVIKQVKDFFSHKVDVVKQKLPEKYFGKFSAGYVFGAVGIFICVCVILFFSFVKR